MIKKLLLILFLAIVAAVLIFFVPAILNPTLSQESKISISEPRILVWDEWTNPDNMAKWLEGFKSIERISGEPLTKGSKYKIVVEMDGEQFEAIEEITDVVTHEKFSFRLIGDMLTDDVTVTLTDKGLTTDFVQSETIAAKGLFNRAFFYWMQSSMAAQSQKNLDNLKKFIEGN